MTSFSTKEVIFYMVCAFIIGFHISQTNVANSLLEQTESNKFYRIYDPDIYYQNFKFNCNPYYLNLTLNSSFKSYQELINNECDKKYEY